MGLQEFYDVYAHASVSPKKNPMSWLEIFDTFYSSFIFPMNAAWYHSNSNCIYKGTLDSEMKRVNAIEIGRDAQVEAIVWDV